MWFVGLLYVLALAIVALTQWIYNWKHPQCDGQLPPGSLGLPLIGETIQFFAPSKSLDIPRFMKHRIHKYGPLFKTSLAGRPVVVSADANFNHYILQQEGRLVEMWYLDSFAKLFGQNGIDKKGSTTATGHVHKYLRNIILASFGPESLKDNHLFHKLEDMADKGLLSCCNKDSVDIKRELSLMIFDTTAKEMFGYEPKNSDDNLSDNFTNFMQGLMSFPLNIPGTNYHRCLQNQKRAMMIIKRLMEERRQMSPEERGGDLLDQVMEDMKRETFLTDEFVAVMVFGLLLATFENLSSTMTLAVKLLADHPQVMQQLVEENEGVIMNTEAAHEGLTWKRYKSMTFTNQVLNEVLRLGSVAPAILRKVIKDVHINGYTIPEGWAIMVVPSILQLNPDTYKDPLAFNPSRWKNMGENFTAKNFIPFGGGSRACAGAEFSKALIAVFLHVLVTKYRWTEVKACEVGRSPLLGFGKGYFIQVRKKETVRAVK